MLANKWLVEGNLNKRNGYRWRHTAKYRKGKVKKRHLTTAEQGQQRRKHRNNIQKQTGKQRETSEQIRGILWIYWPRKQRKLQQVGI